MDETAPLHGTILLLVEDKPVIAMDLADQLQDAGAIVDGPHANVADAIAVLDDGRSSAFASAVLDVDLGHETCAAIALRLQSMGIPFLLHSAHIRGEGGAIDEIAGPCLRKPADPRDLIAAILALPHPARRRTLVRGD